MQRQINRWRTACNLATCCMLIATIITPAIAGVYEQAGEPTNSFYHYNDFAKQKRKSKVAKFINQLNPKDRTQLQREILDNARYTTTLYPTVENAYFERELELKAVSESTKYAYIHQKAHYLHPEQDLTNTHHFMSTAAKIKEQQMIARRNKVLTKMNQRHGLVFLFSSKCPMCHGMAAIVERFSRMYGWHVKAMSIDGGGCNEYPNPLNGQALFASLNLDYIPIVAVYDIKTKGLKVLSLSMQEVEHLEEAIMTIYGGLYD